MGWAHDKKFFANGDDDLKKKKFLEEEEDEEDDYEESEVNGYTSQHPPDGGWGWLVLVATFVLNLIMDGTCFSYGTVKHEYEEIFNATFAEVSVVGSSLTGSYLIVGPVLAAMCFHLGLRTVTIIGSFIAMGGFVLSSFSTSLEMLILTYGIIGGIGLGMMYLPSIICVCYWFEKKLGIATGIAVCGSGVGQFLFPYLSAYLMNHYQWNGKHLIYGAIALHGLVCGAIFRLPDRWHHKRYKRCCQRVEIERGIIMKALIEDKKRQRTISDGSLDNCVITTNNRLIKLEPSLFHCKKSQALRKMLRQLGYSIQSLAVSKTSLQPSNQQILMEALQQQQQNRMLEQQQMNGVVGSGAGVVNSKTNNSAPTPLLTMGQLQKRNSSPDFNKVVSTTSMDKQLPNGFVSRSNSVKSSSGVVVGGAMMNGGLPIMNGAYCSSVTPNSPGKTFPKTRSCDALALAAQQQQQPYNILIKKIMSERVRSNSECVTSSSNNNNPQMIPFGSSPAPVGSVDISIQEIPAGTEASVVGSCYTSNASLATDISSQFTREYVPNSSQNSFVSACMLSGGQLEASIREMSLQDKRDNSKLWRAWYMVVEMVRLMCRPVLGLFLLSSLFTLWAYYIPIYYIPNLGLNIGMQPFDADFLPSIVGITSTIGCLIVGWLADRPWINPLYLNNGALLCAGVCSFILPSLESQELLCVLAAILGFCLAVFVVLRSLLLVKFLGVDLIPKTFGLLCLVMGIASFAGNPMASKLVNATGSLDITFYLAGLFAIISGFMLFPLGYLKRREDRLNAVREAEEEAEPNGECLIGTSQATGVASPVHQCHA